MVAGAATQTGRANTVVSHPLADSDADHKAQRPVVVWIDARVALIATSRAGSPHVERHYSDVPAHHRATGHVRMVGGRNAGAGPPRSAGEGRRIEHLRRYLDEVTSRIGDADLVAVLGPRTMADKLASRLREDDVHRPTPLDIEVRASRPLTEHQLVARLHQIAGDSPARRVSGPYRQTGEAPEIRRPTLPPWRALRPRRREKNVIAAEVDELA